jgi:hypothetical protein
VTDGNALEKQLLKQLFNFPPERIPRGLSLMLLAALPNQLHEINLFGSDFAINSSARENCVCDVPCLCGSFPHFPHFTLKLIDKLVNVYIAKYFFSK